jgi:signal transduction histidine kinase
LVLLTKTRLEAIKTSARMLQTRSGDKRFTEFLSQTIDSDVDKTDSFVRGLMNYVKVSSPVKKTKTVQTLLERVFKKHQPALEQKKIKVVKKLESDLPETTVSDEHLWYILDSLLDYVVAATPPFETVGIMTRSSGLGREDPGKTSLNESHVEILLLSSGHSTTQDQSWQRLGIPDLPENEPTDLSLLLIKEVVIRNRGRLKFETSENRARAMITLTLPLERRKVFYYVTRQEE